MQFRARALTRGAGRIKSNLKCARPSLAGLSFKVDDGHTRLAAYHTGSTGTRVAIPKQFLKQSHNQFKNKITALEELDSYDNRIFLSTGE